MGSFFIKGIKDFKVGDGEWGRHTLGHLRDASVVHDGHRQDRLQGWRLSIRATSQAMHLLEKG